MTADMTDRIGRAAMRVEVPWTPERAALVLRGVHGRRRRQRRLRGLGAAVGVLALVLAGPWLVASLRGHGAPPAALVASVHEAAPQVSGELSLAERPLMRLRDGSLVRPRGRASQVRVREDRPGRTVVALTGAAQFEVVHDPLRLFRVETRGLAVEVLGTRFVVEEHGAGIRVAVQQGRVRVLWASHYDEVGAGHSAVFLPEPPAAPPGDGDPESSPTASAPPLTEPATPSVPVAVPTASSGLAHAAPTTHPGGRRAALRTPHAVSPSPAAPPPATEVAPAAPPPAEPESWQALAHEGQFEQAYSLAYGPPATASGVHRTPPPLLREREVGPGELLLLADVARLSRHPADAVAPLTRLLRERPADPRAPLAAFTLGRVLLDELGRPREAAQSFLRVQELDPDGPLSQDALAREVEAWSRAGEGASARARALHYLQKYPTGRRLRSVRHFGELL